MNAAPDIFLSYNREGRSEEAREAMARARGVEPQVTFVLWELRLRRLFTQFPTLEEILQHFRMAWAATEIAA